MAKTNSHSGLFTPQQELFLAFYTDPKSETFSNALQSGLKAGYSREYSENITALLPNWLGEQITDLKRLRKAEKNLDEVQNMQVINEEGKVDTNLLDKRIKVDIFVSETIGKAKYSKRIEQTGKDGTDLIQNAFTEEQQTALLNLLK